MMLKFSEIHPASLRPEFKDMKVNWSAHPDFADGVTEAFVGAELVERHSVELALVQVGHRPLALLLA